MTQIMTILQIKNRMFLYKDFFGGDIPDREAIRKAKTKKELADILNRHDSLLEDMLSDAQSHLSHFRKQMGLNDVG